MPAKPVRPEVAEERARAIAQCGGNITHAAKLLKVNYNTLQAWAAKQGIAGRGVGGGAAQAPRAHEWRHSYTLWRDLRVDDGAIAICSDAHIWPGFNTPSMRGFVEVVRRIKPRAVVFNGDMIDGARISRHSRNGWGDRPSLREEIDAVQDFAAEVEKAANPKRTRCELLYNIGNHDERVDKYFASHAPEGDAVVMRLEDHFSRWQMQWGIKVNWLAGSPVVIKHRFQNGGVHAGYNATLKAGVSTVSGHTHILECKPLGDYRGRRYGIQSGTLADQDGPAFEYAEGNPSHACQGFVVLTFASGRLMVPELAEVHDGKCYFRGEAVA